MTKPTKSIPELSMDARALANELESTPIGQVVPYDRLSAVISRNVRESRSRSLLASARRQLLKKGILFEAVHGIGLKRLDDSAIVATAPGRVKKVHRCAKRETRKLLCADQAKLSNSERVTHNAAVSMIGTIAEVTRPKQLKVLEKRLEGSTTTLSLESTLEAFKPRVGAC